MSAETDHAQAGASAATDLEVKDAQSIFTDVWAVIEAEFGREALRFPKEIMWLGGAPGSGKGTNTPFILRERGLTAPPIVMSDLFDTPEMRALKDQGKFIGDREAVELLLRELLKPEYATGVVVDGFPRTATQVHTVKMLYQKMMDLRTEFFDTPIGPTFRRPIFRITVLYVDEQTSIDRQLERGRKIRLKNAEAKALGKPVEEERVTDFDDELARGRYQTFVDKTYSALQSLREVFHYHFINAMVPVQQVEARIIEGFQYQSSLELGQDTHDAISRIPIAATVTQHARQGLVQRLDNYAHRFKDLFSTVIELLEREVVPVLQRHSISGKARVNITNNLFENAMAIDMALDVLSDRGFHVNYLCNTAHIPVNFDSETGAIQCREQHIHQFEIKFTPATIRRGV